MLTIICFYVRIKRFSGAKIFWRATVMTTVKGLVSGEDFVGYDIRLREMGLIYRGPI